MMIFPICFRTAAVDAPRAYERTGTLPTLILVIYIVLIGKKCVCSLLIPFSAGLRLQAPRTQPPFRAQLTQQPYRNGSSTASPEKTFQERVHEIRDTCSDPYPRLAVDARRISVAEFKSRYESMAELESVEDSVVVSGRFMPSGFLQLCT